MFNSNPYRHIPDEALAELRDKLFKDIQFNAVHGYTSLSGPSRRELRRVSRELDRRSDNS